MEAPLLLLLLLHGGLANDKEPTALPSFTLASLRPTLVSPPGPPTAADRAHHGDGGHEAARSDSHREDKSLLPEVAIQKVTVDIIRTKGIK
jgi:hypothetical protein